MSERHEFLQTIDSPQYEILLKKAKEHNMSIQKLIRHIIVPEWIASHDGGDPLKASYR